jgi:hypothetical protein
LAAAERRECGGLYFDQWRTPIRCLFRLSQYLAWMARHYADSLHRRPRLPRWRDLSRRCDCQ